MGNIYSQYASNAQYAGDCSIEEVPGAELVQEIGKADRLTRNFEGQTSNLLTFLNRYPYYISDNEFVWCVLTGRKVTENGPTCKVTLDFSGLNGPGNDSAGLGEHAVWMPRSVVLPTSTGQNVTLNYYSPTVTYTYSSNARLQTPQYLSESYADAIKITILDITPFPFTGSLNYTGTLSVQKVPVCTGFERTKKGLAYDYSETIAYVIQAASSSGGSSSGNQPLTQI